jgi:hypothetical protein
VILSELNPKWSENNENYPFHQPDLLRQIRSSLRQIKNFFLDSEPLLRKSKTVLEQSKLFFGQFGFLTEIESALIAIKIIGFRTTSSEENRNQP